MTRIGNQCHRIRQKPKATLDDHEHHVQRHRHGHSGIDALGRHAMSVPMSVLMLMLMSPSMLMSGRMLTPSFMPGLVIMATLTVMIMAMVVVVPAVIVLSHSPHLTLLVRTSACARVPGREPVPTIP